MIFQSLQNVINEFTALQFYNQKKYKERNEKTS